MSAKVGVRRVGLAAPSGGSRIGRIVQSSGPPRPTREQAFEAFCTLLAFAAVPTGVPTSYHQDHLPPGITRDGYLRRHRVRARAGVEGWTRCGQARLVTAQAWEEELRAETSRARGRTAVEPPSASEDDGDVLLDAALGIRARGR